jgi:hypothetical protein
MGNVATITTGGSLTANISSNESNWVLSVQHEEFKQDQVPAELQGTALSQVNKLLVALLC